MGRWYYLVYYPITIILAALLGFAWGWTMNRIIRAFHARYGREPPFVDGLRTPKQWGVWFGIMLAIMAALVPLLLKFVGPK